ncbi:MAG: winged helix-turn-helix domain-containing protein [Moorea sp. SIO4G3]|nr:winged helix-turn-helix domain-containing protein [Moorena sp. SIO4G3]
MKEFELLKYLISHPREVLTREQILENVWGHNLRLAVTTHRIRGGLRRLRYWLGSIHAQSLWLHLKLAVTTHRVSEELSRLRHRLGGIDNQRFWCNLKLAVTTHRVSGELT